MTAGFVWTLLSSESLSLLDEAGFFAGAALIFGLFGITAGVFFLLSSDESDDDEDAAFFLSFLTNGTAAGFAFPFVGAFTGVRFGTGVSSSESLLLELLTFLVVDGVAALFLDTGAT